MSFLHPCSILISGPSNSGKSTFILKAPFKPRPKKTFYFYGIWNRGWEKLKHIKFIQGLPNEDFHFPRDSLIVIDDLMSEMSDNTFISNLFTRHCHHDHVSIILVTHNLFCQGKVFRNISLNTNYLVLFKNLRDRQQIGILDRQLYGSGSKFLQKVYISALSKPYSHLVLDFQAQTKDSERLKSNILGKPIYYEQLSMDQKLKNKEKKKVKNSKCQRWSNQSS